MDGILTGNGPCGFTQEEVDLNSRFPDLESLRCHDMDALKERRTSSGLRSWKAET